jgi:hypothetical protein
MPKRLEISGQRFGRLLVIGPAYADKRNQWHWRCLCDCGNETIVFGYNLKSGQTTSCGCYNKEVISSHKMKGTKAYNRHSQMKQRCSNPKHIHYKDYGGRGITLCEEWQTFEGYWEWAKSNGYDDSLSIERIDVNGNYEPSNCKFIPLAEQPLNTTHNVFITHKGETKIEKEWLRQWSKETGLRLATIKDRIKRYGWTIEEAITIPLRQKRDSTLRINNV